MIKGKLVYEGKAKRVYETDQPDLVLVEYKDDATAFNGEKKGQITDKGIMNNRMSHLFFDILSRAGIATHYVANVSAREMLVKRVEIIAVEVVTRNLAAGSLAKRLGWEEGRALPAPIVELYYKNDELGDPLINTDHALALGLATPDELEVLRERALQINDILRHEMQRRGITLVDFKLEFGRLPDGQIVLADEISPDTCRFWDSTTNEKMDKDRFRRDLGGVEEAYREILRRLEPVGH